MISTIRFSAIETEKLQPNTQVRDNTNGQVFSVSGTYTAEELGAQSSNTQVGILNLDPTDILVTGNYVSGPERRLGGIVFSIYPSYEEGGKRFIGSLDLVG